MVLAIALAVLIGISLGLLGGGGSILAVPVLIYAAGLEPRRAIAASLFVVGASSAAALVSRARDGLVHWRTGAVFGMAGMAGAFLGARIARSIPEALLLLGFTILMVVAAVAMMRPRPEPVPAVPPRAVPTWRMLLLGGAVGLVSGMVGAGGGFVIVPALTLLGGLPMSAAVGTSLLVLALQSFAGFAGHAGEVSIPWALVIAVTSAAIVGSVIGSRLARRVAAPSLRVGFGGFVLLVALFTLSRQLPADVRMSAVYRAIFVDRWPWYVGGGAIAGLVLVMLWLDNKLLGVSTGCVELTQLRSDPAARRSWRPSLLAGIVLGGLVSALLAGMRPTFALGLFDTLVSVNPLVKIPVLLGAGTLIGYGARLAGGCTSGHGIVGVAQGARSSLVATGMFMAAGFAVTQLLVRLRG